MSQTQNISIKALNPDDRCEVKALTELFKRTYANNYPFAPLAVENFWRHHAGQRFMCLIIKRGKEVIGHFGLQESAASPEQLELLFPTFHASDESQENESLWEKAQQLFLSFLERQSTRRSFKTLLFFAPLAIESFSHTAHSLFPGGEAAYLPFNTEQERNLDENVISEEKILASPALYQGSIVAFYRSLSTPFDESSPVFYVPKQYQEFTRKIFAHIGRQCTFATSNSPSPTRRAHNKNIKHNDLPSLHTRFLRRSGATVTIVRASLTSDPKRLITSLGQSASAPHFIMNVLSDPGTAKFSDLLETQGFHFLGILPVYNGEPLIVFSAQSGAQTDFTSSFPFSTAEKTFFTSARERLHN